MKVFAILRFAQDDNVILRAKPEESQHKTKFMNKYEIVKKIAQFAPPESAQEWDCVGFIAETDKTEISKIMLCLTPTKDVIKQALDQNCDMIISHHPMFEIDCRCGLVSESYSPKIDIYSAHTNMDLAKGGTTDTLIDVLGFKSKPAENDDFVRYVELETPMPIDDFTNILRKVSPNLRYVNNKDAKTVKKIGFCAGSGSEFILQAQESGADCFVTGDLKFHTALDSEIVVFDIGHFESEILILPVFKKLIGDGVEIVCAKERSPFLQ